jgi:hypothetical protein
MLPCRNHHKSLLVMEHTPPDPVTSIVKETRLTVHHFLVMYEEKNKHDENGKKQEVHEAGEEWLVLHLHAQVSVWRGGGGLVLHEADRPYRYTTCQLGVEQLGEKDMSVVLVNN